MGSKKLNNVFGRKLPRNPVCETCVPCAASFDLTDFQEKGVVDLKCVCIAVIMGIQAFYFY